MKFYNFQVLVIVTDSAYYMN